MVVEVAALHSDSMMMSRHFQSSFGVLWTLINNVQKNTYTQILYKQDWKWILALTAGEDGIILAGRENSNMYPRFPI